MYVKKGSVFWFHIVVERKFTTNLCQQPTQLWVSNSDEELRFMYKNSQGHLTVFCIVFVWLRGPPSPVRIMTQVPWFMYQNWLGPSGGIYYSSFVPCFVVLYLNVQLNSWFSSSQPAACPRTLLSYFWLERLPSCVTLFPEQTDTSGQVKLSILHLSSTFVFLKRARHCC